ncbi:LysM peptidoglycan-binding domain-containing protein [Ornithobacterium rhinotracheale]|uniref:LysM peptidoglycan-binding domain-containing protein n=1 Tax=Ornithobacterium rhinotracheale TaxID=28251 RepID=UPI00129C5E60|nr:LysM peptidoglycan-binding domain-containing protein [Ornithobacterium rhinotracheale]MRI64378.1 LysM peptidoglycan-binding domain-containing protein [Ornithobacterium rhinotracheale]
MKKFFVSLSLAFMSLAFAQEMKHSVQPKETIYGISKKYGISQKQLKEANPFLNSRALQVGDELVIPSKNAKHTPKPSNNQNQVQQAPKPMDVQDSEDANFYYRVIKPKESVYRLAKKYKVSQETINSLNPFIKERGLQVGDVVRIPKKDAPSSASAQPTADGMYHVKAGDTVYSIAKANGVSEADIYAANKQVQVEGLKAGSYIKIPNTSGGSSVTVDKNWFKYKVGKEETIFSILTKYDITLDELLKHNPELNNGLRPGMTILVPMQKGANVKIVEPTPTDNTSAQPEKIRNVNASKDGEINIAWVLPFYMNSPYSHKGERKVAQEFYMGAQVALDQLIKNGKKVNVKVVDAQNSREVLGQFYNSPEIDKYDAIIGPFFQDMVEFTAQKLENKGIPVFSPVVSSDRLAAYSNVYMATPRDEYAADVLIDDIAKKYNGQAIKILTTSDEKPIAEYLMASLNKKLKNPIIKLVYKANDLELTQAKKPVQAADGSVIAYEPQIAILASENNWLGSQFVKTITKQPADYITGFSLYFVPALDVFDGNNSRNVEALKKIGFAYTSTRMINSYGANEKQVLRAFENKYCQKPTKYMAIGYDVVYDVVDRMDKNGRITDAKRSETRLSSKFGYDKVDNGKAKINKEIRVIRLN